MSRFDWKHILWGIWLLLLIAGANILLSLLMDNTMIFNEVRKIQQKLDSPENLKNRIVSLKIHNKKLISKIEDILVEMPDAGEHSLIYDELERLSSRFSIQLSKITPQPIQEGKIFQQLVMTVALYANFDDLLHFIYEIEHQKGLFRINQLELEPSDKRKFELMGKLKITSYLK